MNRKGRSLFLIATWAITLSVVTQAALAQPFPGAGQDKFSTNAAFKVVLLGGAEIEMTNLSDPATVIGRSDPFTEATEPVGGAPIPTGPNLPEFPLGFSDVATLAPDSIRPPTGWLESDPNRREVHTEILSLNLTTVGGSVKAGQAAFDVLDGLGLSQFYRNSFGEVASQSDSGVPANDFQADSFFNVFTVVEAGPFVFLNKHPLVVRREDPLTEFPPTFGLPTETYIHDPNFPAVALFDTATGLPVGYLQSAGHGQTSVPTGPEAQVFSNRPVSFSVDNQSLGLTPAQSTLNNVRDDIGLAEQQVTVYENLTPFENQRNGVLSGVVGAMANNFQNGDRINSMSSGRDGTLVQQSMAPGPGVLYFSVDRASQGALGTDVNLDATMLVPGQAASLYITGVDAFGSYSDTPTTAGVPTNDNFQATDATLLGLRPSLFDAGQDNVEGFELSAFDTPSDIYYGTYTGPSFDIFSDRATIFAYNDSLASPFEDGNLFAYALPDKMGLALGDVIDALALSDTGFIGFAEPLIDRVLFSLAPGSPTLGLLGLSAADIFVSDFDGNFSTFASYSELGLLFTDNVDAIDIVPVPEPASAVLASIAIVICGLTSRRHRGKNSH